MQRFPTEGGIDVGCMAREDFPLAERSTFPARRPASVPQSNSNTRTSRTPRLHILDKTKHKLSLARTADTPPDTPGSHTETPPGPLARTIMSRHDMLQ